MPPAIENNMLAPCGMNCMVCYKHCNSKKSCAGCLSSDPSKPEHCRKCKISDCARKRHITHCYECPDFPCNIIKQLDKSYVKRYKISLIENSRYAAQNGLQAFMDMQVKKSRCSRCGGIISLHDFACSECGAAVQD